MNKTVLSQWADLDISCVNFVIRADISSNRFSMTWLLSRSWGPCRTLSRRHSQGVSSAKGDAGQSLPSFLISSGSLKSTFPPDTLDSLGWEGSSWRVFKGLWESMLTAQRGLEDKNGNNNIRHVCETWQKTKHEFETLLYIFCRNIRRNSKVGTISSWQF